MTPETLSKTDLLYKIIGKRIQAERRKIGLSQDVMAHVLGLSRISISAIESGKWHPKMSTIESVCDALGISFWQVLEITKEEAETYEKLHTKASD